MTRLLPPSFAHILLCAVLMLSVGPAAARSILDLDVQTQPAQLLDWGDYVIDERGDASLQAVLAKPGLFRPTLPQSSYSLRPGQSLWIRFTVPAAPDDQRWYVRLANPGLDLATLYTLGSDGNWSQQKAGDSLPVSSWALPHLYPVLPLVVSAADPTRYVLRVQASDGLTVPIEFVSESRLSSEQQRMSLLYGVYFGLLAMGAFFALVTGLALRDTTYLWFGLWSAAATLTAATAVGIAGLHFWPESPAWSDASHYVMPAASTVPFVLFVAKALLIRERAASVFWFACALAMLDAGGAFLAGTLASPLRLWLALTLVGMTTVVGVGLAMWSWRHGDHFALKLLLAMAPMLLVLPLQLEAAIPWLGLNLRQQSLPIVLLALAFTICASYLLLALRSQERRDHRRRIAQLHEIDPTTGLVNDTVFAQRMRELIERAKRFDHQSVVAIVDLPNLSELRAEFGRKQSLELLLRLAERLNSMMRTIDTVARLGESRFGLLVDGPVPPSRAKALCAKVIAHCIMPLGGLPQGMVVKPRIALALVPGHGAEVQGVMERLDEMLRGAAEDPTRIILMAETMVVAAAAAASAQAIPAQPSTVASDTDFQATSTKEEADY